MTPYIHCHIGELPPDYLLDSITSIDSVDPGAKIVLITDQQIEIDGIDLLQVDDIACDETRKVMGMELFSNESNPLWRRSIFRIFLVRDALKYLGIESCYHFDSDVLMFQPSTLFSHLIGDGNGLSITYHNETEVVFGFSKFSGIKKIDDICAILHDVVFDRQKQYEYGSNMPNEMRLLHSIMTRRPDLISVLNILPNETGIIFDPSSYGQFFGGTHQGHSPGFAHHTHIIGREIQSGNIVPFMKDKKPYVSFEGKDYPIVNLHIHSKITSPFL